MAYIRRVPKPWLVIEQPMLGEFIVASDEERTQHRIAGKVVARYPTKKAALEVADGMNEDRSENPRTVPTTEVEDAGYGDRMMRCVGHPEHGVKTLSRWIKFVGGDREAEPTFEWRDDGGFEVIIPARTGRVVLREIIENPRTVRGPRRVERPDGYYYQMTGPKRESGPYCSQCGTLKRDGVCPVCRPYDRPLPWDTPCQNSNTKV